MDAALMLKTAAVLLGLTAVGGLIMAFIRFSGADRPPSWLAMAHGLLAASGLTLLLYLGFAAGLPGTVWLGIVLLATAALGGLALNLMYHSKMLSLPKNMVIGHAALAVVGYLTLLFGAFK